MSKKALAALILVPLAIRAALVLLVDDFDADSYMRMIMADDLSRAWLGGTATWGSINQIWLPAWHLVCAAVETVIRQPYWVPKFLSAIFGGLAPAIVFLIARRIGGDSRSGWIAWLLATFAPLHLIYSATAMTEAFFVFWFVLSLYCFIRSDRGNAWLIAAAAALIPAALTRYDLWVLLGAMPLIALIQRRARFVTFAIAALVFALPPLAWFALNFYVTGDPLHFSKANAEYLNHFFACRPSYADRGPLGFAFHFGSVVATIGALVVGFGMYGFFRIRTRDTRALAAILASAFGFLFALWIIRQQIGWMRHYIAIGMILTVMASLDRKRVVVTAMLVECAILFAAHTQMTHWALRWREAADFLHDKPGLIVCNEPGVVMLSGLPRERFTNGDSPSVERYKALSVRWVVFSDADYSQLPEAFPEMRDGGTLDHFRLAYTPPSNSTAIPKVYVYELQ